jgi:hypothetical protein
MRKTAVDSVFALNAILRESIQIHRLFAEVTALCSPEEAVSAVRALVALFLGLDPFFGPYVSPLGHGPHNNLLAHGNREIADVLTGKFIALVTPLIAFLLGTGLDRADGAVRKHFA